MAGRFLVVFRHSLEACQALLVQVPASSGQVPAVQGHCFGPELLAFND